MSAYRSQEKLDGDVRPIVVNVCNFAKGSPCLLSYDDARTLFHEFGHALHQMLSDVTYGFISGTSVARDFVELPSQLYEHWLEVPAVLDEFALNAETGAELWKERLSGDFKASPIAANGKIYLLNKAGLCTVLVDGPTFTRVAENQLDDETLASPAAADGKLYIRGHAHLYCIGK